MEPRSKVDVAFPPVSLYRPPPMSGHSEGLLRDDEDFTSLLPVKGVKEEHETVTVSLLPFLPLLPSPLQSTTLSLSSSTKLKQGLSHPGTRE